MSQKYVKKGQAPVEGVTQDKPEEVKKDRSEGERTEDSGRRGGRGSRGTRGGNRGRGQGEEGRGRPRGSNTGRGGGQHRDANREDASWYEKYHYAHRPRYNTRDITLETEVPAMIPKEQRKKKPTKDAFEKAQRDQDHQIDQLWDKIKGINLKKKEIADGGKMTGSNVTYSEAIKAEIQKLRVFTDEIKQI